MAVPLIGFWPVFTGTSSFFISYDNVEQFYPWYQKLSQAVHLGYLPLWDANVLGGHSFVGEFQTGVFYLPNILFVSLFGTSSGIDVRRLEFLVVAHYIFASVTMFAVARKLGYSNLASAVTAVLLAYSGAVAARASGQTCIFFGDTLIPLVMLFALVSIEKQKAKYSAFAGCAVGFQVLAGHLQPPSIAGLIVVALFVNQCRFASRRTFAVRALLFFVLAALIVGSPQLFFGFQYLADSYRWVGAGAPVIGTRALPFDDYTSTAFTPSQLLNVFDRTKFSVLDGNVLSIGFLPLVVLAFAFAGFRSRVETKRLLQGSAVLAILACFSLLMILGPLTPVARIVYSIPFAAAAVRELGRYAILIQLFLVLATGAAIDGIRFESGRLPLIARQPLRLLAFAVAALFAYYIFTSLPEGSLVALLVLASAVAMLVLPSQARTIVVAIAIAGEVTLWLPTEAKSTEADSYPPRRFAADPMLVPAEQCFPQCRIIAVGDTFPANIGDVFPVQTVLGHGATMYVPYYDLMGNGGFDIHGFVEDVLGVRYIIADHALTGFRLVTSDKTSGRFLYERLKPFPKVFSYDALTSHDLKRNDVTFKTIRYADLASEYEITAPKNEKVVFSEQFYPGWKVAIDGRTASMLAAPIDNSAPMLRTIDVVNGTHTIDFVYPR